MPQYQTSLQPAHHLQPTPGDSKQIKQTGGAIFGAMPFSISRLLCLEPNWLQSRGWSWCWCYRQRLKYWVACMGAPKVRVCRALGKLTLSRLWLKFLLKVRVCTAMGQWTSPRPLLKFSVKVKLVSECQITKASPRSSCPGFCSQAWMTFSY